MSDGTAAPAGRTLAVRLSDWRWARVWLRSSFLPEQNYLVILAVVVGVVTGLGSVGFILFIELLADFARGPVAALLERFGPARLVLLPALGGLMVGPLVQRFGPEAKGHGVPEVMTALATRGGHIRKRIVAVKVVAASLTIGFGGAAGRVGPLVQIGSAIGSTVGRLDTAGPAQRPPAGDVRRGRRGRRDTRCPDRGRHLRHGGADRPRARGFPARAAGLARLVPDGEIPPREPPRRSGCPSTSSRAPPSCRCTA